MHVIRYPFLQAGTIIGITAPSSGVKEPLHELVKQAISRLEAKGYRVVDSKPDLPVGFGYKCQWFAVKTNLEKPVILEHIELLSTTHGQNLLMAS